MFILYYFVYLTKYNLLFWLQSRVCQTQTFWLCHRQLTVNVFYILAVCPVEFDSRVLDHEETTFTPRTTTNQNPHLSFSLTVTLKSGFNDEGEKKKKHWLRKTSEAAKCETTGINISEVISSIRSLFPFSLRHISMTTCKHSSLSPGP